MIFHHLELPEYQRWFRKAEPIHLVSAASSANVGGFSAKLARGCEIFGPAIRGNQVGSEDFAVHSEPRENFEMMFPDKP